MHARMVVVRLRHADRGTCIVHHVEPVRQHAKAACGIDSAIATRTTLIEALISINAMQCGFCSQYGIRQDY